ncbi:MAG: hypothetical protein MI861_04100, partial [Pirellulales bacterium]|nr:hypothetical protein [Pirellulales bacterium]
MWNHIYHQAGNLVVSNSTLSGNTAVTLPNGGAGLGGAIFSVNGRLDITHATIASNTVSGVG